MTDDHGTGAAAHLSLSIPGTTARSDILAGAGTARMLPGLLAEHAPAHRYAVIADAAVAELHAPALMDDFGRAGLVPDLITFASGEASKSAATWASLLEEMASRGLGRDACVIGLGGGVATDLAGFVAATFMRGIPVVHVPTSLLAMIDAAIGGKTGIDLRAGKNLAGAFHQPRLVVVDPELLGTLPDPALRAGLAEAIKHGAVADAGHFDRIGTDMPSILDREPAALSTLVVDSIRIKARLVAQDPREGGSRALLNFGHTIGHGIEAVTGYRVSHGAAVAIGMVAEATIGEAMGITRDGTAQRLRTAIDRAGLPVTWPDGVDGAAVLAVAGTDKKAREGVVRYVLLREIGHVARAESEWTHPIPASVALEALRGILWDG